MIIWINGAFGAGKTTLAAELQRRMPDAINYDPEYVGDILTRWVSTPGSGDFQDLPLWRKLAAQFAIALAAEYRRTLIVPMTLVNPQYRDEIFGLIGQAGHAILHVFLDVPAGELHRRIDAQLVHEADAERDTGTRAFRHRNVERCVAARAALPPGTVILRGDQHTPADLAGLVLSGPGCRTGAGAPPPGSAVRPPCTGPAG